MKNNSGIVIPGTVTFAVVVVFLGFVVLPGYRSTSSRLYPTSMGYPAMLRFFGRPIPVEAGKAERATLKQIMMGQGALAPRELVSISTRAPNKIAKVLVDVGAHVHRGQLLLQLDAEYARNSLQKAEASLRIAEISLAKLKAGSRPEILREKEATLQKAKGDLETAREQLARETRLFDQGAVPREELEQYEAKYRSSMASYASAQEDVNVAKNATTDDISSAQAQVDSARAEVFARRKDLEETDIVATTDGIIIARQINPGEVTRGAGDQLLAVAHGLEFMAQLDQQYTGKVRIGQEADVTLEAVPGHEFHGKVVRINPAVDTTVGRPTPGAQAAPTFRAWIELTDLQPGISLAPGLEGFARIVGMHDGLAVPSGAIINFSGGEGLVLAVQESRVAVRPVRFGGTSDKQTEILRGLNPGDVIITSGQEALQEGDKVSVQEKTSH